MKNDAGVIPFEAARLSPDAIVDGLAIAIPMPVEIKNARARIGMSLTAFGKLIGAYRCGWESGRKLAGVPYSRQAVSDYERGTLRIGKPFAYAFWRWVDAFDAQLPPGVRFLPSGVTALCDIPAGALICVGKVLQCRVCGRWMLAWPTRKYCPECKKRRG